MSSFFTQCLGAGYESDASDDEDETRHHALRNLPAGTVPSSLTTGGISSATPRASGVDQSVYKKLEQSGAPVIWVNDWRAFQLFKSRSSDKNLSYKKRRKQAGRARTEDERLKLLGDHIMETNDRRLREFAFLQHAIQRVIPDKYYDSAEDRERLICDLGYTQNEWTHVCIEVNEHKLPDTPLPAGLSRRYGKNVWLTVVEIEELMNAVEKTVKDVKEMVEGVMKKDKEVNEVLITFWERLEMEAGEHKAQVEQMEQRQRKARN